MFLFGYRIGHTRNTLHNILIAQALDWEKKEGVLESSVRPYFGDQEHPVLKPVLSTYTANRKTNAVGKSDYKACKREFRLAIVTLQDRAIADCGNATINNYSFNYENELPSAALLDRFLLDSPSLVLHGLRSPGLHILRRQIVDALVIALGVPIVNEPRNVGS